MGNPDRRPRKFQPCQTLCENTLTLEGTSAIDLSSYRFAKPHSRWPQSQAEQPLFRHTLLLGEVDETHSESPVDKTWWKISLFEIVIGNKPFSWELRLIGVEKEKGRP